MGTSIVIQGSNVTLQDTCACPPGTNIKVKNLFFNVPARRRFLKTDATELRNILSEFYRIVLVNPQCQFLICNNDEVLLDLPQGTMKQRIEQVFGKGNKQFTTSLVELKSDTELISIRGFVGKPEFAAKTSQQFFFVNNRFMRHPYFHKAVMTAYQGMLSAEHNPSYFIYFDINPEAIDVNIHPTKTEIKFVDEHAVWQILLATVREALGKFNIAPTIDFESSVSIEIPAPATNPSDVVRPEIHFDPTYNPFRPNAAYTPQWGDAAETRGTNTQRFADPNAYSAPDASSLERSPYLAPHPAAHQEYANGRQDGARGYDSQMPHKQPTTGWEQLYEVRQEEDLDSVLQLFDNDLSALTPYQFANRYIFLPAHGGLLVIDQHRAHLCVLYEQLRQSLQDRRGVTQQLLFPEVIELTIDEMQLMLQASDELRYVGFDIDQFSPTSFSINGLPAILGEENAVRAVQNILAVLSEEGQSARERWREEITLQLAEEAAIPAGRALSDAEMRDLIRRLFDLDHYAKTPSGKTVMNILRQSEIDKLF